MTTLAKFCASFLLTASAASIAQAPIIEPSPDQQAENKTVCRSEPISGSRFQARVCHTNKEWADIREQSMREVGEINKSRFGSDSMNSEAAATMQANGPQ
jgi:hypothetical protein